MHKKYHILSFLFRTVFLKNVQEVNFVSTKGVVINLPKDLFVGGFNITILLSFLHKNRNVLLKKQQWA